MKTVLFRILCHTLILWLSIVINVNCLGGGPVHLATLYTLFSAILELLFSMKNCPYRGSRRAKWFLVVVCGIAIAGVSLVKNGNKVQQADCPKTLVR